MVMLLCGSPIAKTSAAKRVGPSPTFCHYGSVQLMQFKLVSRAVYAISINCIHTATTDSRRLVWDKCQKRLNDTRCTVTIVVHGPQCVWRWTCSIWYTHNSWLRKPRVCVQLLQNSQSGRCALSAGSTNTADSSWPTGGIFQKATYCLATAVPCKTYNSCYPYATWTQCCWCAMKAACQ